MNYYQIHKNKQPKRLRKAKINYKKIMLASILTTSSLRISQIQSNINENKHLKAVKVFGVMLNTAKHIQDIYSPKQRYLNRINKTRN